MTRLSTTKEGFTPTPISNGSIFSNMQNILLNTSHQSQKPHQEIGVTFPRKGGFISLFTVLLATVILAISVGMSSVALKQLVLAGTADEANEAFYSADSAMQCAIMHDMMENFEVGGPSSISCGLPEDIEIDDGDSGIYIFNQTDNGFNWNNGNCARVFVNKGGETTQIEAFGYNVPCEEVGTNPRTVERALRVRYGGI